jgi:hypothetical protein
MIIGRGSIASVIPDREGFIFFANGISNRTPLTDEAMNKERQQIMDFIPISQGKMFVYVSGLNIYYKEGDGRSDYTQHKLNMEDIVKCYFKDYCIFRLGSITWGDNPNTILNYMKREIIKNGTCEAKNVYRYFHTKEELAHWFGMIPTTGKHEMNVTGRTIWVPDLVEMIKKGEI